MIFSTDDFQKFSFTQEQLEHLKESALRDVQIAKQSEITEIRFKFSYDAVIKIGLFFIAKEGYRVRSIAGHHIRILEKLGEIAKNDDIAIMGNIMRQKRNRDLYEGISSVTDTEIQEFLSFIAELVRLL